MTRSRIILTLGLCASLAVPAAVSAGTATSNVAVSATVSQVCTIQNATLGFGAYDPVSANATTDLTGTASLVVACTKGATGVTISLDNGLHVSGSQRQMASGANSLQYNLFQDSGHATAWNTTSTYSLASPASKAPQTLTIYGVVPKAQDVAVGSYADTVVATINF